MQHSNDHLPAKTPRQPEFPADRIFVDRWSPRAFSDEIIPQEELQILFEAARWAPSAYNNQPWRFLYARRDGAEWGRYLQLLVEPNRVWCARAGALLVIVGKSTFDHNGQPSRTHQFDSGAAWAQFALQAALRGYAAHGMEGFDYDRARSELGIPVGYTVLAMAAVGRRGEPATLPEKLRQREVPNDRRKIAQSVCEGLWSLG